MFALLFRDLLTIFFICQSKISMHMKKYDILIIGSGLGGLTCGSILSKEGYKVCILEQNPKIGGCLQNFHLKGQIFDTGIHYVGGFEKGQPLNKIFGYLGFFDKLKLQSLNQDNFDVIHVAEDDTKYPLGLGHEKFIDNLSEIFPEERENIINYCNSIQTICKSFHLYQLEAVTENSHLLGEYSTISVGEFIDSITKNEKLRTVLAGNNMLYAGEKYKTPVFVHALISNMFITGAKYFVDGSQQLADELARVIQENGGEIFTRTKVVSIDAENKMIQSLMTDKGESYQAEYYISSIHPSATLELIDQSKIQKSFRKRISAIENTTSGFILFIVLKEKALKYLNYNYYYGIDYESFWGMTEYSFEKEWPKGFMILTPPHSDSPEYAKTAIVNSLMNFEDVKQWENTTVGKRGKEYKKFKQKCVERMLDLMEEAMPGFRDKIAYVEAASPLTIRDYTGSKEGTLYGTKKTVNEMVGSHIPVRTKLKNLLLTGQNLNMHGILGVPLTAIQTCGELVGLDYLIDKINRAAKA